MRRDAHRLDRQSASGPGSRGRGCGGGREHRLDRGDRDRAAAGRPFRFEPRLRSRAADRGRSRRGGGTIAVRTGPGRRGRPRWRPASSTPTRRPSRRRSAFWRRCPSRVVFVLWSIGAVVGLLVAAELLRRRLAPQRSRREVLFVVAACAPLTLPFAVGLLFGNLDVWFPLLYGAMLLAAVAPGRATAVGGGVALAFAAVKLHPASLGLWFLTRAFRDAPRGRARRPPVWWWRPRPWWACSSSARASSSGARPSGRSTRTSSGPERGPRSSIRGMPGIAAQIASLVGADDAFARSLHLVVAVAALLVTVWAAWRRPDPVESFAWAAAASLATLPVTWYHYPSAMLPIAVAAMLRASGPDTRRVSLLVAAGAVVAAISPGLAAAALGRGRPHRGCGAGVGTGAGATAIRQGCRLPQPDDREQDHPGLDPDHRQRQPDGDGDGPAAVRSERRPRR